MRGGDGGGSGGGDIACVIGDRFGLREASTGADARIWVKVSVMTRKLARFKIGISFEVDMSHKSVT